MTTQAIRYRIGIIGGSGFENVLGLEQFRSLELATPYGPPSSPLLIGEYAGADIAFLQRHGPRHAIPPSEINSRANIAALRHVGCRSVLSFSAVGSLKEELPPGTLVLVDQFIDRTTRGNRSFFGHGMTGHVTFGDPTCARVSEGLVTNASTQGLEIVRGGTYMVMEGPQFSTRAESRLYRSWGCSVIGMTAMPEAKLAREAGLCYAMIALVTDYDSWSEGHRPVSVADVERSMQAIRMRLPSLISDYCKYDVAVGDRETCGCNDAPMRAVMSRGLHGNEESAAGFRFMGLDFSNRD
jgi:5'-methylthioadenosine phosphorylase